MFWMYVPNAHKFGGESGIRPRLNFCRHKSLPDHRLLILFTNEISPAFESHINSRIDATGCAIRAHPVAYAERVGFEPTRPLRVWRFSKPLLLATQPSLQREDEKILLRISVAPTSFRRSNPPEPTDSLCQPAPMAD
ncbi:MAG: hypothetical protein UW46_C0002G0008 [Candidatus Yanofskybacteria bacterium GW2011_GWF1_44_227]|uniref:Uncharacterized protein n=1 Tax=Candidatus Yanofskybacteria bacterium GW2011_GWE2_40_11 TaxID=1619033 RepID=A0A0G0TS49_9BACT|nr:MAG: hypothetical protein UT69_C0017G0003 [Candidatus Yanofskybacteria bacterium GW2011_GWE1_40_10]KKR40677.1 MAG: hypothetical protein UT75_C0006G0056 [Candidatus Yanofskybacteria bacterium GW2011_GWE2_40_11]KKT15762.1 MAG: hypothetical protein UV97_C0002G0008 [Candidatus Yanofskybacteria bacterium GW2011_GWF2_43_596]KKT53452.1 MAG: hypothetical protein UW46_C0002G0008 [Candidatus Yanofskybacteria bacterium GW2011_GWF1_44_227]